MPSIRTSSAPGMASAVALPPLASHSAVSEAVDHEGGDREMSQAFGPISGGDRRDRLTSDAGRIVGAVVGAARSRGDFLLVRRISRRADGAESPEPAAESLRRGWLRVGR